MDDALDSDKGLGDPGDQALEPEGCFGGCKADAILAFFGHGRMVQIVVRDLDIAGAEAGVFVAERAFQNQGQFQPAMAVIGDRRTARGCCRVHLSGA